LKTALITGASRGIGYDLAKEFARLSYRLVLVSRNLDRLEVVKRDLTGKYHADVIVISQDLSVPQSAVEIYQALEESRIEVDVLVNNAGVGDFGEFKDEDLSSISRMLNLNIVSLTELTRLFLKGMVERGNGKILNVASLAAFLPGPYMAVYYASKAYVKSFSQALSDELKETGITVTAVCPGLTKTGFQHEIKSENSAANRFNLASSSAWVAEIAIKAMLEGKEIVVPGVINSSIARTANLIPDGVKSRIVKKIQEFNRMKIFG
jgi:short-subunit dehydrogenase